MAYISNSQTDIILQISSYIGNGKGNYTDGGVLQTLNFSYKPLAIIIFDTYRRNSFCGGTYISNTIACSETVCLAEWGDTYIKISDGVGERYSDVHKSNGNGNIYQYIAFLTK